MRESESLIESERESEREIWSNQNVSSKTESTIIKFTNTHWLVRETMTKTKLVFIVDPPLQKGFMLLNVVART